MTTRVIMLPLPADLHAALQRLSHDLSRRRARSGGVPVLIEDVGLALIRIGLGAATAEAAEVPGPELLDRLGHSGIGLFRYGGGA